MQGKKATRSPTLIKKILCILSGEHQGCHSRSKARNTDFPEKCDGSTFSKPLLQTRDYICRGLMKYMHFFATPPAVLQSSFWRIPGRWAPAIYSIIICPLNHPSTVSYRVLQTSTVLLITALSAVLHMNCSPETACVGFCAVWILPVRFCLFVGWLVHALLCLEVLRKAHALSSLEVASLIVLLVAFFTSFFKREVFICLLNFVCVART